MVVKGLIQRDQDIAVYLVLDDGTPVHVFTISSSPLKNLGIEALLSLEGPSLEGPWLC